MNHLLRIFLMVLSLSFATEMIVPVSVQAATPQTEKQKAAEKKKKEAAKAKAAKEKEKAKAAKAKEKAKADAAKAKEKADAAKAKEKADAQKVKEMASARKAQAAQPVVNETEAYEQRLEEIRRYNEKAMAYNNKDIEHRLGMWGQVGYSAIFPNGVSYDANTVSGFDAKALGHVGGGAGLGYQLRYQQFLFTTGLEMQFYNSLTRLSQGGDDYLQRTYPVTQYPGMFYTYQFNQTRDQWLAGYIQLPVLMGMELRNVPLFWQAGVKVGYGVLGSAQTRANLTTCAEDVELSAPLGDQMSHALVSDERYTGSKQSYKWGLNAAAAAEIGVVLDQWTQPTVKNEKKITPAQRAARALRLRLSVFAEYGFLNTFSKAEALGEEDIPMTQLNGVVNLNQMSSNMKSALHTTTASALKTNPFLVGVKMTMFFALPRKQKELMKMPKEPTPRMTILAYNADNQRPVAGSTLSLTKVANGKETRKATNSHGVAQVRLSKGEYQVSATKLGFYPSDTVSYSLLRDLQDTLRIALRPEPIPVVYTLCTRVYDKETGRLLSSNVRFSTINDTTSLYVGETAEDGLCVTDLTEGNYIAKVSSVGYMDQVDTLQFVQDTLSIYLTPIKPGIKVKIEHLFFATNKTIILPESEQAMEELAGFLESNPTVTIHITGHTDAVGSDRANQILSEGRAKSVRSNLIMRGIDGSRITTEGKGESEPVADNETEEGRALNRRVEFTITSTGGEDIEQIK